MMIQSEFLSIVPLWLCTGCNARKILLARPATRKRYTSPPRSRNSPDDDEWERASERFFFALLKLWSDRTIKKHWFQWGNERLTQCGVRGKEELNCPDFFKNPKSIFFLSEPKIRFGGKIRQKWVRESSLVFFLLQRRTTPYRDELSA